MVDDNPAFVLTDVKKVTFENRPVPQLKEPTDVRVRIEKTGICGSDVHYWQKGRIGDFVLNGPMGLGHESSGVIEAVGSKVKGLKAGDRVAIEPGVPCRFCDFCREGLYNHCPDTVFAATPPHDGTLQKYYITSFDYCYKIPDHLDMEQAAMVEPVSVAVQIAKRAQLKATDEVVVFGCGPIGLLCQAVAKAYGCKKVVGVDISDSRLEFAKGYAADHVFKMPSPGEDESEEAFAKRAAESLKTECGLKSIGADVILEATGAQPCIQAGVFASRPEARFVQAGMGREFVSFPTTAALIKQLNWTGSLRYTAGVYPTAVELVALGKVDVKPLITNRFKFEQAEQAFELVKAGKESVVKVIIDGVPN